MEPIFQAHPIPQNVTNFEFHLVGDMTLKQFAYLAAGVGFAFLIFTTLSTAQPIIAWPIIIISSLLGVAFAFLPIQERPLDHWVAAFFKAIYKPTSLKFSSKIINPQDPLFNRRLSHYLKTYKYVQAKAHAVLGNPNLLPGALSTPVPAAKPQAQILPQKKQNFIDKFKAGQTSFAPLDTFEPTVKREESKAVSLNQIPQQAKMQSSPLPTPAAVSQAPIPLPDLNLSTKTSLQPSRPIAAVPPAEVDHASPQDLKKTVELAKKAQETQTEIVKIESALTQIKQQAAKPGIDPKTYIENFEELLTQLQELNKKASQTAKELAEVSNEVPNPASPAVEIVKAKSIPTLKLTGFPNVISGIVTDSKGNYIEGAIVVAHDRQGLPVRALKSNKLGQFVAATPLPNGNYSIATEKDDLIFDKVSIELTNEVLPPILVEAKKLTEATS